MKLKEIIEQFLEAISETSQRTYTGKMDVFLKFLIEEKGVDDTSYESYLKTMKVSEIVESLNYYIETCEIKSESVAWHFISVVKRFFSFIYKSGIKNDNLLKSFGLNENHDDSFQSKIREKIDNDPRLEKKGSKVEISWEEAEILISECDQRINELVLEGKILEYNKYASKYNDYISTIIIKLILFTGVPYKDVRKIKYEYFDQIYKTICINGYCIHLPNRLSEQLSRYLDFRKEIESRVSSVSEELFIQKDGSQLDDQTATVADTLKEYIGRTDLTGIVKFAVIEMIKKEINQSILQDFTGVGGTNYEYCHQKAYDNKESINRYLDSKLRSLEIFDEM